MREQLLQAWKTFLCFYREKFLPFYDRRMRDNLLWILVLEVVLFIYLASLLAEVFWLALDLWEWSPAMYFIHYLYTYTIGSVVFFVAFCLIFKRNRFILRAVMPKGTGGASLRVPEPENRYPVTQNNTVGMLLLGLLIGFLTNSFCVACATLHGDIHLYLDFSPSEIPALLFALLAVLIQCTSEEIWCRGFLYERLAVRYPLWVPIVVNGVAFGLMHSFNDGVSVLAVCSIAVAGICDSLVRWYSGSIWLVIGMHTMWNFTQNFLCGLPNSGFVSEFSVLHLDAPNGVSNLIYDFDFGVESTIPAIFVFLVPGIIVLLLAKKKGRLGELRTSYRKKIAENS